MRVNDDGRDAKDQSMSPWATHVANEGQEVLVQTAVGQRADV